MRSTLVGGTQYIMIYMASSAPWWGTLLLNRAALPRWRATEVIRMWILKIMYAWFVVVCVSVNGILLQQFCNFRQPSCIGPFSTRIHLCRLWVNMPAFEEFILLNNIDHTNCHLQKCKIWRIYSSDALASIKVHIRCWTIPQICKKQSGSDIKVEFTC